MLTVLPVTSLRVVGNYFIAFDLASDQIVRRIQADLPSTYGKNIEQLHMTLVPPFRSDNVPVIAAAVATVQSSPVTITPTDRYQIIGKSYILEYDVSDSMLDLSNKIVRALKSIGILSVSEKTDIGFGENKLWPHVKIKTNIPETGIIPNIPPHNNDSTVLDSFVLFESLHGEYINQGTFNFARNRP